MRRRTHVARQRRGFVVTLGHRDQHRHFRQPFTPSTTVRQGVHGIHPVHDQYADFAPLEFLAQAHHGQLVAEPLPGRSFQVERRAVGSEELVDEIRQPLQVGVDAAANHEGATSCIREQRAPPLNGLEGEALRQSRRRYEVIPGPTRDRPRKRREYDGQFVRRDHEALVGLGAGQRHAGLDLHVPAWSCARIRRRAFDGRMPCTEEISVERNDDVRAVDPHARQRPRAVRRPVGFDDRRARDDVVDDVTGVREALEESRNHRPRRGTGGSVRPGDNAHGTLRRSKGVDKALVQFSPRHRTTFKERTADPVVVVQAEDRGLAGGTKPSVRNRMAGQTLQLERARIAH